VKTVDDVMKEIDDEYSTLCKLDDVGRCDIKIPSHLINKVFPLLRDRYEDFQLTISHPYCTLRIWN
jgi:hypothetical protein